MGDILPPPSTSVPAVTKDTLDFTPVWRQWFVTLAKIINKSGGSQGSAPGSRQINTTAPLGGGGDLTQDRTLMFTPAGANGAVQYNNAGVLAGIAGFTGTITTARLTGVGVEGSMTFVKGVLTAQVQAT